MAMYKIQGCGSGSGLDPDPYWESGSRGKKTKKFQWKNALFSDLKKHFTTEKLKITQILFSKKFEKEIVFESSVLA
jgi:hypothetical protein